MKQTRLHTEAPNRPTSCRPSDGLLHKFTTLAPAASITAKGILPSTSSELYKTSTLDGQPMHITQSSRLPITKHLGLDHFASTTFPAG